MRTWIVLLITAWTLPAAAQETRASQDEAAGSPARASESAPRDQLVLDADILELDPVDVSAVQWTFEQELALRVVRQALDTPRSLKREHWDDWVCWFERPVGTRHQHLLCARNGDLVALRPRERINYVSADGATFPPRGQGSYGTILSTTRPVLRAKVERLLRGLPGSSEFDREFVNLARLGERPPRDIPSDDELDEFATAWMAVNTLSASDADDTTLEAAIEDAGLDVGRFNRIAELTQLYQSIENEVAVRLQASRDTSRRSSR